MERINDEQAAEHGRVSRFQLNRPVCPGQAPTYAAKDI